MQITLKRFLNAVSTEVQLCTFISQVRHKYCMRFHIQLQGQSDVILYES